MLPGWSCEGAAPVTGEGPVTAARRPQAHWTLPSGAQCVRRRHASLARSLFTLLLERFSGFSKDKLHSQTRLTFLSMKRAQIWLSSENYILRTFRKDWAPCNLITHISQQGLV